MKKRILIVEDERDMAEVVSMRLRREGYDVDVAYDGEDALAQVRAVPLDLAIVDIMLPKLSGTDLVMEMRRDPRTASVPIIMMTAKGEESDIVVGLRLGADDYVTKPFSLSVLVARVAAVLRRAAGELAAGRGAVKWGCIEIDPERHAVRVQGKPVALTRTEFRLLVALVAARGRVLTRNQLVEQAIGFGAVVTDRTVDVHVTALRRKLGEGREWIETVRGVGYRMAGENDDADEAT